MEEGANADGIVAIHLRSLIYVANSVDNKLVNSADVIHEMFGLISPEADNVVTES
jgi:hypothetical protein